MNARAISAWLPEGRPGIAFRGMAGMAWLAELPLVWNKIDGTRESRWLALLFFIPLAIPLALGKMSFPGWLHMGVAAGTAGGVAMLIGDSLDHGRPQTMPCGCLMAGAGMDTGLPDLLTWSNGLMMLACVVSSVLLCPGPPISWCKPGWWVKHAGCFGGMWLGMSLGGHWLSTGFSEFFGKAGGMHLAMVAGMVAGAGLGHRFFLASQRSTLEVRRAQASFPARRQIDTELIFRDL